LGQTGQEPLAQGQLEQVFIDALAVAQQIPSKNWRKLKLLTATSIPIIKDHPLHFIPSSSTT